MTVGIGPKFSAFQSARRPASKATPVPEGPGAPADPGVSRMRGESSAQGAHPSRALDSHSAREAAHFTVDRLRDAGGAAALAAQGEIDPGRVMSLIEFAAP